MGKWNPPPSGATAGSFSGVALYEGAYSVPNGSETDVSFASEDIDSGTFHDNVTSPERITIPTSGPYLVGGTMAFTTTGLADTARAIVRIVVNGTPKISGEGVARNASSRPSPSVSILLSLVAGDYLTLRCFQNAGGARTAQISFWAYKVG